MRVRGTAQQLYDKYSQLARDAASSNDRVLGEAYYQHAEHYFRIISAINAAQGLPPPSQGGQNGEQRYQNQGEYQRREQTSEGEAPESRESRQETREYRDNRQGESRHENREHRDNRQGDNRQGENRQGDNRQERRFEQRPRQEFQPRDRHDRHERHDRQEHPNRFSTPIADTPIDISSALEAELRAAANEGPAGLGEQPEVKSEAVMPEPRAIPIKPEAPPAATPELTLTEPNNAAPKRRGRPPRAKAAEPAKAE